MKIRYLICCVRKKRNIYFQHYLINEIGFNQKNKKINEIGTICNIISSICYMLQFFLFVHISHVKREDNRPAHILLTILGLLIF